MKGNSFCIQNLEHICHIFSYNNFYDNNLCKANFAKGHVSILIRDGLGYLKFMLHSTEAWYLYPCATWIRHQLHTNNFASSCSHLNNVSTMAHNVSIMNYYSTAKSTYFIEFWCISDLKFPYSSRNRRYLLRHQSDFLNVYFNRHYISVELAIVCSRSR